MYDHYKSRFYIELLKGKNKANTEHNFLKDDESWSKTAFDPKSSSHKYRDRIVFSGGQ